MAAAQAALHDTPASEPGSAQVLAERFAQVSALAGGQDPRTLALAQPRRALRTLLQPLVGRWHDGDENLVRGLLEGWDSPDADRPSAVAARLLAAGEALAGMGARREAWWFYVWEMESLLALVAGGGRC